MVDDWEYGGFNFKRRCIDLVRLQSRFINGLCGLIFCVQLWYVQMLVREQEVVKLIDEDLLVLDCDWYGSDEFGGYVFGDDFYNFFVFYDILIYDG